MKSNEALQQFVEDELLRAPLLIEQVLDGAIEVIRKESPAMSPRERSLAADLQRGLLAQRSRLVSEFVRALREAANKELTDAPSTSPGLPSGPGALSLVDEGEVDVDVEISRAIEAIRSVAEFELRELMSYVSALVGDMDVARDYNPFRADVMARAMWSAAQALPMPQPYQLALMRHACMPLAQLVRKSYAGACARLESQGIEPAVYRTIIVFGGSRRAALQSDSFFDPASNRSEQRAKAPLDQVLKQAEQQLRNLPPDSDRRERDRLRNLQQQELVDSADDQAVRDLIELLAKLFDAVLGDRRLAPDIQNVVSRLQAPALRLALRDAATLDNYTHPVWLLMDRMALQGDLHGPSGDPERARMLRFMHGLLDTLAQEQAKDSDAFRWARERVLAYERHRFEQRRTAAESELHALQERDDRAVGNADAPTTSHAALDVGQLDTVPAELLERLPEAAPAGSPDAADWLNARRSGEWFRMFMQGSWVHAQLIWYGTHREYWLLADGASPRTWAVRRRALERLYSQQLLSLLQPRQLIRDAAERVLQTMTGEAASDASTR